MNPAGACGEPLRYFIHDDSDALRMEIAGSFVGRAAQKAYEGWRSARFLARHARLVIDISYVTEADDYGKAVLQAWQGQDASIVASSFASQAIADSILNAPIPRPLSRRTVVDRLASLLCRLTAANSARAEAATMASAGTKQKNAENAGFLVRGAMEQQLR